MNGIYLSKRKLDTESAYLDTHEHCEGLFLFANGHYSQAMTLNQTQIRVRGRCLYHQYY